MAKKSYYTMYRKIIRVAWQRTWERKPLWLFGFFAAALSTGGVADVTVQRLQNIHNGSRVLQELFTGTLIDLSTVGYYISQQQHVDPTRRVITATILVLGVLLLIAVSAASQGALIRGLSRRKSVPLKTVFKNGLAHFWRIIGLNITAKLAQLVLVLTIIFPAALVLLRGTMFDAVFYFIISLIFFPAAIIVHIIAMLALIDIVRKDNTLAQAIHRAADIFKRHWLPTLELGILLFFIGLAAILSLAAIIIVLAVPYTVLSLAAMLASPIFLTLWQIIAVTALIVLISIFIGGVTTFQYATWLRFYDRTVHKTTKDRVMAKLERWWRKAWE